jgi:hypothetical protein
MGILMGYYFGGASGMILGLILTTWMNIPFQDYFFYKNVFSKNDIKSAFLFLLPLIPFSVLAFTDSYLVQLFATGVFIVLYYYTYLKRIL